MPLSLIPILLAALFSLAFALWARREARIESRARELQDINDKLREIQREAELIRVAALMDPVAPVSVAGGVPGMRIAWLHMRMRPETARVALGAETWGSVRPEVRA